MANEPFGQARAGEGMRQDEWRNPMATSATRGVIFIHSAPRALCAHIEWALNTVLNTKLSLEWTDQPVVAGGVRTELTWKGEPEVTERIVTALKSFPNIRFEVTQEPCQNYDGQRYVSTPSLGVMRTGLGVYGQALIEEDHARNAVAAAVAQGTSLTAVLDELLGGPWDRELEPFRSVNDAISVRWLNQVG